jgi:hypothetical protein
MKNYSTERKNVWERSVALFVLLCLLFTPFSSTRAEFSDTEISSENLFSASSIDIELGVLGEGTNERTFSVTNIGLSPLNYDAHVTETSDPSLSFCDEVIVTQGGAEGSLLSLTTPQSLLDVGGFEDVTLEFSVDNPGANLAGKACVVEFIFEASQVGYNHGEAFFDTEIYTLTLYGEDFYTEPTPDNDPCCTCGDVVVENENDATIINIVHSSSNTGDNSAGGGGSVTTGDATTTTTIVNSANTNNTTDRCEEGETIDEGDLADWGDFFDGMF